MFNENILKRIYEFDNYSRDEFGDIEYDKKLDQFILNCINDEELSVIDNESYLDYDLRMNPDFNWSKIPDAINKEYHYVSSVLSKQTINTWAPGANVLISAGTGKGKNTFIKEQLLKHYGNEYIIIFENRESLLSQQKIEMIKDIDADSLKYQDIDKDNMIIFGAKRNIMLISYQKAALKLLYGDKNFFDFLSKVRYAVFDEIHYLIDDSEFNKGVNLISDYLIVPKFMVNSESSNELKLAPNEFIPNATKIFMSGSMEEVYLYLQAIGYSFNEYRDMSDNDKCTNEWADAIRTISNSQKPNHIVNLPSDYSYIKPFAYTEYSNIIDEIKKTDDKWLIFINSKSEGTKLEYDINDRYGDDTAVFINADNKKSKGVRAVYQKLLKEEKFDCKVLLATNVIYNGINIKDSKLKNIVLPETTLPVMKQLIGRKRLTNKEDNVNVFFPKVSADTLKKRFENKIKEYFDMASSENNLIKNVAAVNGLIPDLSKYVYTTIVQRNIVMPDNQVLLCSIPEFRLNLLANIKLHFDTMFYLYLLKRVGSDEDAYPKVLLEHLGVGEKANEIYDVTPLSDEVKFTMAKEKLSLLLDKYIDNPMVDECVNDKYTLIPEFTAEFNSIYCSLYNEAIDSQWKSKSRLLTPNIFNEFINKLKLDYFIEISKKDRKTNTRTLTVKHKQM